MARFRKKPLVIEATQFNNRSPDPSTDPEGVFRRSQDQRPYVGTLHDERHYIEPGDWVITEPNGENHYPCKDEVFRERYEPVEVEDPVDALMRELAALPKGDRACAVSLFGRKHGSGDYGQSRGSAQVLLRLEKFFTTFLLANAPDLP